MTRRARVLLALPLAAVATFGVAGCKAVQEGAKAVSDTTVAGDNSPNANALACVNERQEVQLAVDSFTILRSQVPTEAELVPDFLRNESALFDLAADGTVIPAPGSGCS